MRLQKITEAWFKLPNDPDKAEFYIKHLRAGEISEIQSATQKQQFEYNEDKKGELQPVPIFKMDIKKETELTIIKAISNWKNIFDCEGKPLKCSKDNKLRLCRELSNESFINFGKFIQKSRQVLEKTIKKEEEESLGN